MKKVAAHRLPSGSWRVQVRVGEKRVSVTRETKRAAESEAMRRLAEYEAKGHVSASIDMTIGAICDRYIEDMRGLLAPATAHSYEAYRHNRMQSLMRMRFRDVTDWQNHITQEQKSVSAKTVQNVWVFIHAALVHAGLEPPKVRLPKVKGDRMVFLDEDQIPLFLDAIHGSKYEVGCLLALHSLRRSELCGLRWSDLDLRSPEAAQIHVRGAMILTEDGKHWERVENTKTSFSERSVPIFIPRLYELLTDQMRYHAPDEMVIPWKISVFLPYVKRTAQRTDGLPDDLTLHDLRRSFCSLCWALGIDMVTTMRLGGWGSVNTMVKYYTRLSEMHTLRNVEKLREFYDKKSDPAVEVARSVL